MFDPFPSFFSGFSADFISSEVISGSQVEQPVVQLPKKSCDAICKRLRQHSSGAKNGLVAFLLSYTWQTLVGKKAGGIGVRMLLQLVARADAGALASNLVSSPVICHCL